MKENLILKNEARRFAEKNKLANVGDKVETTWASWKHPRTVEIYDVGAKLAYDEKNPCEVMFQMYYYAKRIRADGTYFDSDGSGIVLGNMKTSIGKTWTDELTCFNHCGLSWSLSE